MSVALNLKLTLQDIGTHLQSSHLFQWVGRCRKQPSGDRPGHSKSRMAHPHWRNNDELPRHSPGPRDHHNCSPVRSSKGNSGNCSITLPGSSGNQGHPGRSGDLVAKLFLDEFLLEGKVESKR